METLQRDNRALITFEGRAGGETFDSSVQFDGGTTTSAYPIVIGSNKFIGAGRSLKTKKEYQGFEEQLIGMKKGEERIIEVIFPPTYHEASLAGEPSFFKVKLIDFS